MRFSELFLVCVGSSSSQARISARLSRRLLSRGCGDALQKKLIPCCGAEAERRGSENSRSLPATRNGFPLSDTDLGCYVKIYQLSAITITEVSFLLTRDYNFNGWAELARLHKINLLFANFYDSSLGYGHSWGVCCGIFSLAWGKVASLTGQVSVVKLVQITAGPQKTFSKFGIIGKRRPGFYFLLQ